jgi:hypothetical protein
VFVRLRVRLLVRVVFALRLRFRVVHQNAQKLAVKSASAFLRYPRRWTEAL